MNHGSACRRFTFRALGANETDRLGEYERGFRRAGLPLFVADRSAATDVFNRAAPLLGLVFLGEMLGALNLDWSPLANVAALAGGLVTLLAAIALTNKARGRPAAAIPQDVGSVELALFVIVPALLPLVFNGQWRSAIATAAGNLALLGPRLRRDRVRAGVDPALDARAARRAAPRVAGAVRARDPAAHDLLRRPLPDGRDVGGLQRPAHGVVRRADAALRGARDDLPGRSSPARGAWHRARGRSGRAAA